MLDMHFRKDTKIPGRCLGIAHGTSGRHPALVIATHHHLTILYQIMK
jgi:hypothetical protein